MTARRTGWLAGIGSYVFWGLAPLFFKLLDHLPAPVVIAHRILWAAVLLGALLLLRDGRSLPATLAIGGRRVAGLTLTGILVAGNWLLFVWAVSAGQVLATSLGYFINPIVTVLLAMLVLRERLTARQRAGLAIAALATLGLALHVGEPPWISLGLAGSFGLYGLARKMLAVPALIGLFWETLLLLPLAMAYLLFVVGPEGAWLGLTAADRLLLSAAGLVTLLPLAGFNVAAQRLPLATLGFLQYIAPSLSFLLAVFVFREPFGGAQLLAFGGIWSALLLFSLPARRRPAAA